jgi:DNA-binding MarR family transcriptional regulator
VRGEGNQPTAAIGMGLTRKQADLLAFIRANPKASYRQISGKTNLGSISSINRLVVALEERGHIRRTPAARYSITVLPAKTAYEVDGARYLFIPVGRG